MLPPGRGRQTETRAEQTALLTERLLEGPPIGQLTRTSITAPISWVGGSY